jgi:hypothetical protein
MFVSLQSEDFSTNKELAQPTIVPYWSHSLINLHSFLYPFICSNGVAYQSSSKRNPLGGAVWLG